MRVTVCADVHLGNHRRFGGTVVGSLNDRCRQGLAVFEAACKHAIKVKTHTFVVAGDLFDYAKPEPALLAKVQDILSTLVEAHIAVYLLMGNHDRTSTVDQDNALAPLAPFAHVVSEPMLIEDDTSLLYLVPHQRGPVREWLPKTLEKLAGEDPDIGKSKLLVMHMGIKDSKTPPWLRESAGAISIRKLEELIDAFELSTVLAGDWHDHRIWELEHHKSVAQIGALVPTGWDNPGIENYGSVAVWEPAKRNVRPVNLTFTFLPGPRFVKVTSKADRDIALAARQRGHVLFISETCAPEDWKERAAANTLLAETLIGEVGGVETIPDEQMAKGEAKLAASLARSQTSFDEALKSFVDAMPISEDVSRAKVLERVQGYIVKGQKGQG
jgi:DNA repair exonuclease SbcCD nuclease subunit